MTPRTDHLAREQFQRLRKATKSYLASMAGMEALLFKADAAENLHNADLVADVGLLAQQVFDQAERVLNRIGRSSRPMRHCRTCGTELGRIGDAEYYAANGQCQFCNHPEE